MVTLPSLISLLEGHTSLSTFLQSQGIDQISGWAPAVDIDESRSVLLIKINIAGVEDEDLKIDFYNNLLKIGGVRNHHTEENLVSIKSEIPHGQFEREIILPISVTSQESVNIETKNGMIFIRIDKEREERNRFSINVSNKNPSETNSPHQNPSSDGDII